MIRLFWRRPKRKTLHCIDVNILTLLERTRLMAIDLTKLNAGIAAVEAKLADLKTQNDALTAQVADLQSKLGDPAADQAAVDAAGDKLAADAAS